MSLVLFLALAQSAGATPPTKAEECRSSEGEIVVCGSRKANERYRLRPVEARPEPPPPKAEVELAEGMTLGAGVDGSPNPAAAGVPRLMVKFKLKF